MRHGVPQKERPGEVAYGQGINAQRKRASQTSLIFVLRLMENPHDGITPAESMVHYPTFTPTRQITDQTHHQTKSCRCDRWRIAVLDASRSWPRSLRDGHCSL